MQSNATEAIRRTGRVLSSVGSAASGSPEKLLVSNQPADTPRHIDGNSTERPIQGKEKSPSEAKTKRKNAKDSEEEHDDDDEDEALGHDEAKEQEEELTAEEKAELEQLIRNSNSLSCEQSKHQRGRGGSLVRCFTIIVIAVIFIRVMMKRYKPEDQFTT